MNQYRRTLLSAIAIASVARAARAQGPAWPTRPVRIVVSGGPGGVADIRARWLAERLAPLLGQPVVVENRAGAGGNIGAEFVARIVTDGHTLLVVHQGTLAVNPHLYPRIGYDPIHDFAPITRLGVGSLLLAVHTGVRATSVSELIELARAKPGALSYGSPGIGTPPHLASELFVRAADIKATHIPYKGGGALVADLIAGHITWSIEGMTAQAPHVQAGRLRALAVTTTQRVGSLPDVPTMAEAGVPGYEFVGWAGLAAPATTPKPVIARLYAEIAKVLATAEARDWFATFGAEPGGEPPEVFADFIRAEHAKWGKVIREANIKIE